MNDAWTHQITVCVLYSLDRDTYWNNCNNQSSVQRKWWRWEVVCLPQYANMQKQLQHLITTLSVFAEYHDRPNNSSSSPSDWLFVLNLGEKKSSQDCITFTRMRQMTVQRQSLLCLLLHMGRSVKSNLFFKEHVLEKRKQAQYLVTIATSIFFQRLCCPLWPCFTPHLPRSGLYLKSLFPFSLLTIQGVQRRGLFSELIYIYIYRCCSGNFSIYQRGWGARWYVMIGLETLSGISLSMMHCGLLCTHCIEQGLATFGTRATSQWIFWGAFCAFILQPACSADA